LFTSRSRGKEAKRSQIIKPKTRFSKEGGSYGVQQETLYETPKGGRGEGGWEKMVGPGASNPLSTSFSGG